ncbi:unnamed protein product [Lampetra planeri]
MSFREGACAGGPITRSAGARWELSEAVEEGVEGANVAPYLPGEGGGVDVGPYSITWSRSNGCAKRGKAVRGGGGVPATDLGLAGSPPIPTAEATWSSGLPAGASPVPPPTALPTLVDVPAAQLLPAGAPPVPTAGAARGGGPAAHTRSRGMHVH